MKISRRKMSNANKPQQTAQCQVNIFIIYQICKEAMIQKNNRLCKNCDNERIQGISNEVVNSQIERQKQNKQRQEDNYCLHNQHIKEQGWINNEKMEGMC